MATGKASTGMERSPTEACCFAMIKNFTTGERDKTSAESRTSRSVANIWLRDPPAPRHERVTQTEIARRIAALRGWRHVGDYDPAVTVDASYFVPDDTLSEEAAQGLGIKNQKDLFGGVVPFPFVATKAITHPLVNASAKAPSGWSAAMAGKIEQVVFDGFTAFSKPDAHVAYARLVARDPVRLKPVHCRGGTGQVVVRTESEFAAAMEAFDAASIEICGLVLETDLRDVKTHSVGFVDCGNIQMAYCGQQNLTRNNKNALVYGGSSLLIARGGADDLRALLTDAHQNHAVEQAIRYDTAALQCFPGLFASRRNYDVLQGTDSRGQWRSGVLEQSWRIGGASTAEIVAIEALHAYPSLNFVRAHCVETYGKDVAIPAASVTAPLPGAV